MCAFRGECCRCCVVYKFKRKRYGDFYIGNTQNTKKRMEQPFQHVPQRVMNDNNLESFADNLAKCFTQKPSPQQFCKIISFEILSTVNHIGSMKTWG